MFYNVNAKEKKLILLNIKNISKKITGENKYLFDLRISLFCFFSSLFLAFPALWIYLQDDFGEGRILGFIMQAENPLRKDLILINKDWSVLEYRIFVPLINKIFGFRNYFVILPALFCNFFNLYLCSKIFREKTENLNLTLYSCFALSLSFFVVGPNVFWGTPDSVAFTLALIPAAFNLPISVWFLCLTSSLLVDERSIISFIFLFFYNGRFFNKNLIDYFDLKKFIALITGFSFWQLIRYFIDTGLIGNETTNSEWFKNNIFKALRLYSPQDGWFGWIVNIFAAFKWIYFIPIILFFLLIKSVFEKRKTLSRKIKYNLYYWFIYLLLFLIWIAISIFNGDVHRTISFAFFFIIESINIFYIVNSKSTVKVMQLVSILMLLTPVFYLGSNGNYWDTSYSLQIHFPFPAVMLKTIFGS